MNADLPDRRRHGKSKRRRRKAKRRGVLWTVTGAALAAAAVTTYGATNGHQSDAKAPTAKVTSTVVPPLDLTPALAQVNSDLSGAKLSVAVLDIAGGKRAAFGTGAFETASIVKVDILATLLLQAQDGGRELNPQEQAYAADMIKNSDNEATSALWTAIGSARGLDAANVRLGLKATHGGGGTVWGLTTTTAEDQVRLLQAVFGNKPPLTAASRSYIQDLMHHIAEDQDWGVSAAADAGSAPALKNGWLQRTVSKKWDINSIGRIETGGRAYFVAVLLNGCTTEEDGIALVEKASRAAVSALTQAL